MQDSEIKPRKRGASRKGKPNKVTKELKDIIRGALDDAGGRKYLATQAKENPAAFMGLIGKIIPKDVSATINGDIRVVSRIELVPFGADSED